MVVWVITVAHLECPRSKKDFRPLEASIVSSHKVRAGLVFRHKPRMVGSLKLSGKQGTELLEAAREWFFVRKEPTAEQLFVGLEKAGQTVGAGWKPLKLLSIGFVDAVKGNRPGWMAIVQKVPND